MELETCDSKEELERSQSIINLKEEEKNKVEDADIMFSKGLVEKIHTLCVEMNHKQYEDLIIFRLEGGFLFTS